MYNSVHFHKADTSRWPAPRWKTAWPHPGSLPWAFFRWFVFCLFVCFKVSYPPFPQAFNYTAPSGSWLPLFLFWPSTTYSFFLSFSFFFWIIVNQIEHKIYHFNHVYMYSSVALITFTLLCNHHHSLFPKLYITTSSSKTIPSFPE